MNARKLSFTISPGSKKVTQELHRVFFYVQDVIAQPPPGELGNHAIPEGHVLGAVAVWTLNPPGPETQQQPFFVIL
jgi:hypothetical protein